MSYIMLEHIAKHEKSLIETDEFTRELILDISNDYPSADTGETE